MEYPAAAVAFIRSVLLETASPMAVLIAAGRAGFDVATFVPNDPEMPVWIAKRASRHLYMMTAQPSAPLSGKAVSPHDLAQTRIVGVIVPSGKAGALDTYRPRPSIMAETSKGIAAAWRLRNPAAPAKARALAAKIAGEMGGRPLDHLFPLPGIGAVRLIRHIKGPQAAVLVTDFDAPMNGQAAEPAAADEPLFVPAHSFEIEETDWLWPNVIACGDLTLLGGAPGMGKSQVAIYAAATVSRGEEWTDGRRAKQGSTILCETEDRPSSAIRPRLEAAGADLARVHFGRHMDLSTGMTALASQAEALPDLRLLVLSPVLTFFGPTSNDDNTVRAKLRPLLEWAAARNVAVLGIIHPLKDGPVDAFAGCDAYRRACRAAWRLVIDPADPEPIEKLKRRVMVAGKVNNAPDALRLLYHIQGVTLPMGVETSRVEFLPMPNGQGIGQPAKGTKGARVWLSDFLAHGAQPGGDVKRAALAAGIAKATLYRAAREMGIVPAGQDDSPEKLWAMQEE
jgi:putative DNA primase/helicase